MWHIDGLRSSNVPGWLFRLMGISAVVAANATACIPQRIQVSELLARDCKLGARSSTSSLDVYPGQRVELSSNTFEGDGNGNYHTWQIDNEGVKVIDGSIYFKDFNSNQWVKVSSEPGVTTPDGQSATKMTFEEECPGK